MEKPAIIVAVTGGIAAFKSAALTSQLVQQGFSVTVVMTPSAEKFVGAATFRALTGKPVVTDLYDPAFALGAHIELARSHSLLCVAPATANFIGKAANGIADDLLTTLYLCFTGRVVVAPAMNVEMWNHPAVKRNIEQLREDGVDLIDPASGWLSCRVEGKGRMAEPELIFQRLTETAT